MADATLAIKLSEDDTRRAVASAVAAFMTPEVISASLTRVLDEMMKPNQHDYPNHRSRVVVLFEEAISKRAAKAIDDLLDKDENFQVEILRLVGDGIRKVFADGPERNKVVDAMAAAFATKLAGR